MDTWTHMEIDGDRLPSLRKGKLWLIGDLAKKSGVRRNLTSTCELGKARAYPDTIRKLAAALDVDPENALHLRHLKRYPLRTPYPEQADRIARLMRSEELISEIRYPWEPTVYRQGPELVVDATGVGRAVTDLLRERNLWFRAVTITGGDTAKYSGRGASVPKRDLVAAIEVPFHSGTLKVAEGLEFWLALKAELLNFRRKVSLKTAHDSYEHWRETDHDDLVLAAALACWWARRQRGLTPVPMSALGYPKPKGW